MSREDATSTLRFLLFFSPMNLTLDFQGQILKSHISGMGWPIDMELRGCEALECWTHVVTFNVHLIDDLDLGFFSRSNFENAVSQEWDGRLTWPSHETRTIAFESLPSAHHWSPISLIYPPHVLTITSKMTLNNTYKNINILHVCLFHFEPLGFWSPIHSIQDA